MKNEKWKAKNNEKRKKGLSDYICDWVCEWLILPNDWVKECVSEKASKTFYISKDFARNMRDFERNVWDFEPDGWCFDLTVLDFESNFSDF